MNDDPKDFATEMRECTLDELDWLMSCIREEIHEYEALQEETCKDLLQHRALAKFEISAFTSVCNALKSEKQPLPDGYNLLEKKIGLLEARAGKLLEANILRAEIRKIEDQITEWINKQRSLSLDFAEIELDERYDPSLPLNQILHTKKAGPLITASDTKKAELMVLQEVLAELVSEIASVTDEIEKAGLVDNTPGLAEANLAEVTNAEARMRELEKRKFQREVELEENLEALRDPRPPMNERRNHGLPGFQPLPTSMREDLDSPARRSIWAKKKKQEKEEASQKAKENEASAAQYK